MINIKAIVRFESQRVALIQEVHSKEGLFVVVRGRSLAAKAEVLAPIFKKLLFGACIGNIN